MPQLVRGAWVNDDVAASEMKNGAFEREPTTFRNWITPDGAPGPDGQAAVPAEAGRYRLFVSYLCPWASRTIAMRNLKGLAGIIPMSVAGAAMTENGWEYDTPQDTGHGTISFQHQLYTMSVPDYTGKVSVPVLWDMKEGRIVNNESADILRIFNTAFDGLTGNDRDFYPVALRPEIDRWNALIYDNVNNGVYRAGFARTQSAYETAVRQVFAALDQIEAHLGTHRYLAGVHMTEADLRLFVTLVRFDAAYVGAFKCNLRRIADYPNLSGYMRELHQIDGIGETVKIEAIKKGYFSIAHINPTRIVPLGPEIDFASPHGREHLEGRGLVTR